MHQRNQPMLTEAQIMEALRDCYDPEWKLNVVDLGLIYSVTTGHDPGSTAAWPRQWLKVTMTLATADSPANGLILEQVNNRLAGLQQISKVDVELAWEPAWNEDRVSAGGKQQLEREKAQAKARKRPENLVNISLKSS